MSKQKFIISLLSIVFSSSLIADTKLSASLKDYFSVQQNYRSDAFSLESQASNALNGRIMVDHFADELTIQVHYEAGFSQHSIKQTTTAPSFGNQIEKNSYRFSDIKSIIVDSNDKQTLVQNLDRFNFQWQFSSGDLTVGRQALTLGSARVINPTDVFLPFDLQALNTEYRRGIDAIRFQKQLGQLSELDFGVVLGKNASKETSAVYAQLQTNVAAKDLQLSLIHFSENTLLGIGVQSSILNSGYWFEAARTSLKKRTPILLANAASDLNQNYWRLSTGLDYALNAELTGLIEYHYNGAGSDSAKDYPSRFNHPAYQTGGVFLLAKHYVIPALTWQASALLTASAQVIYNVEDKSNFTNLTADYSLSDNLYFGLSLQYFSGKKPKSQALRSEYGNAANRLTCNLRYYF